MILIRASILVVAGLLLVGCGADGEPEQPTRGAAVGGSVNVGPFEIQLKP